jgi:hypothetical protein
MEGFCYEINFRFRADTVNFTGRVGGNSGVHRREHKYDVWQSSAVRSNGIMMYMWEAFASKCQLKLKPSLRL